MKRIRLRNKSKPHYLMIFFALSIFYFEFVFKFLTQGRIQFSDILLISIFSFVLAIIFYILASIFYKNSFLVSITLLIITALIFISQMIYYEIFNMYYTLYSASNVGQVFEFWPEAINAISKNLHKILLLFVPVIVLIVWRKKFLPLGKVKMRFKLVLVFTVLVFHVLGIGLINMNGKGPNTAYDIYYNTNFPLLSIEKFGLMTTMRIDAQRNLTGWTPSLAAGLDEEVADNEDEDSDDLGPDIGDDQDEEEVVIEYNTMDIDFDKLIAEEEDSQIVEMHKYFQNVDPTSKNDYTGKYEGYNLIFLTAEGFSPYAVHKEVTPTLYKMLHEGYYFKNFYTPIWEVSTSDGEYVATTGLIPKSGVWSLPKSGRNLMPFTMGNQLAPLGYKTMAYHNHTYDYYDRDISHPNMGYDYKGVGNGLEVTRVWPASDLEMMENSISEYIDHEPFHAYYMTVSGHLRYTFTGNSMAAKNRDLVKDLPYSDNAKAYIACNIELDRALEYLLKELEARGIADKTLIAMSADHYPYGLEEEEINELAGHTVEKNFELYKNHFILYTKGMEPQVIEKPASSLDIIPTLSNMLGLEYDSRLLMGRDIFSDSDPLVIFLNRSFITDRGKYNAKSGEFIQSHGDYVSDSYIDNIMHQINAKFYYSTKILETDYYNKVLGNE